MGKILNTIKSAFGREAKPAPAARPRMAKRYAAAKSDRLVADWLTSSKSANSELREKLSTLRARSRQLERDDDYFNGFLRILKANVVGSGGVKLQIRIKNDDGSSDRVADTAIEGEWSKFKKLGNCATDTELSMTDIECLIVASVARDGEVLIRKVTGRQAGNPWGFRLHLLEADHLDDDLNETLSNGNHIIMGVEVDKFGRRVAYHLWDNHPGSDYPFRRRLTRSRVPADQILHLYIPERIGQVRGVPWGHTAMRRLHHVESYEEAELVASRVAASKMGFFKSTDSDSYEGDGEEETGEIITETEPGIFEQLPDGVDFTAFDPQHPTSQFKDFIKSNLRGASVGLGAGYNTLANDLEGVNFSSLRQGALNERDLWKLVQFWLTGHFHDRVFADWLKWSLTTGEVPLPASKFFKFNQPIWVPRGWKWIDPQKEVAANIAAIEAGLTTRSRVLNEQGQDFEEILDELAKEKELAAEKGIQINSPSNDGASNGEKTGNDQDNQD